VIRKRQWKDSQQLLSWDPQLLGSPGAHWDSSKSALILGQSSTIQKTTQRAGLKDPCLSSTAGTFYPPAQAGCSMLLGPSQSIGWVLGETGVYSSGPSPNFPCPSISEDTWVLLCPSQNSSLRWTLRAPMCMAPRSSLPTASAGPSSQHCSSCSCPLMPCPTQAPSFSQLPRSLWGPTFQDHWCPGVQGPESVQHTVGMIPKSGRMPGSPWPSWGPWRPEKWLGAGGPSLPSKWLELWPGALTSAQATWEDQRRWVPLGTLWWSSLVLARISSYWEPWQQDIGPHGLPRSLSWRPHLNCDPHHGTWHSSFRDCPVAARHRALGPTPSRWKLGHYTLATCEGKNESESKDWNQGTLLVTCLCKHHSDSFLNNLIMWVCFLLLQVRVFKCT
jgi:hypothetical protein